MSHTFTNQKTDELKTMVASNIMDLIEIQRKGNYNKIELDKKMKKYQSLWKKLNNSSVS